MVNAIAIERGVVTFTTSRKRHRCHEAVPLNILRANVDLLAVFDPKIVKQDHSCAVASIAIVNPKTRNTLLLAGGAGNGEEK